MQVFDAIRTRLTVHEFKPDAAPDEVVDKLLQMGRWAAEKMSTLRRLALNPAKGEKSLKIWVAAKRKRAGCDFEYPRAIFRLAQ